MEVFQAMPCANNYRSFPYLRNAKHIRRQQFHIDGVPMTLQSKFDTLPRFPPIMPENIWDILDEKEVRFVPIYYSKDEVEEVPPLWAIKAQLFTCLREWLAGEPCAENIVWWNFPKRFPDIPVRTHPKVLFVDVF